jgi:membrane protein
MQGTSPHGDVTNSRTGRLFGPVVGLMVFAYFVSRFRLFLTAWAAVVAKRAPEAEPENVPEHHRIPSTSPR